MIRTSLTEILGIQHPILSAPMGSVSGGVLASAVSGAGGLGFIGGGYGEEAWLSRELELCDPSRVGVGFITWHLPSPCRALEMALERRPRAIFLSFGDPAPYLEEIRAAGIPVILQVQSVEDARRAADQGAAVIVAQGTEAGGHGAARATLPLVPAVVDAVSPIPVVAAGGITDGRGVAAALLLGAAGALLGTRFMATPEALISPRAKSRLVESTGDDTLRTTVFDKIRGYAWPTPYTGRALRNAFTERWHGREQELEHTLASERVRYAQAVAGEDFDQGVVFTGEGVDLVRKVTPAAEILAEIMKDAQRALKDGAELLHT